MPGDLAFVAVMHDGLEEGRAEDAPRQAQGGESRQLDRPGRLVGAEVEPQRQQGVAVGVPPAAHDDQSGKEQAGGQGRPAPPPSALDARGKRHRHSQDGKEDHQPDDGENREDQEFDLVQPSIGGAGVRPSVHVGSVVRAKRARSTSSTRSLSPRALTARPTAAATLQSPVT